MQIRLGNIGIIKNSTLILDGLTVMKGKNNSGKATVSKALYAMLDDVCDIHKKADKGKKICSKNSSIYDSTGSCISESV